jgi:hypothetical protein
MSGEIEDWKAEPVPCAFEQPIFDILLIVYSDDLQPPFDVDQLGLLAIMQFDAQPRHIIKDTDALS